MSYLLEEDHLAFGVKMTYLKYSIQKLVILHTLTKQTKSNNLLATALKKMEILGSIPINS